jgi:hypothetical protein
MVTFLFIAIFIIGVLAVAVYFWQRPQQRKLDPFASEATPLRPPSSQGLFSDPSGSEPVTGDNDAARAAAEDLATLVARAESNDTSVLLDASTRDDKAIYEKVLNLFVEQADSDPKILALVSFVLENELQPNPALAAVVIESWKGAPNKASTSKMLHVAALSDDVPTYQKAVETTLHFWLQGRLSDFSPVELRTLLDGEFWVLSSSARNTGAGFILKRTLASARRELQRAANVKKSIAHPAQDS